MNMNRMRSIYFKCAVVQATYYRFSCGGFALLHETRTSLLSILLYREVSRHYQSMQSWIRASIVLELCWSNF